MKKKLIVLFLLIIIPFSTLALSDNYVDKVADIVKVEKEETKLFYIYFMVMVVHIVKRNVNG